MNEKKLTYWEEKELELAMLLLPHAEGWTDRRHGFDAVKFSLMEAKRLVEEFKKNH